MAQASVETEEGDEQAEYEKTTQDNAVMKTLKDQDVKYKGEEIKSLDKSLVDLTADHATKETELNAVLEYYAQVKDRCIAKAETYETRVAKREAEIKGLKQALVILQSETAFTQRRKGGFSSGFLGASGQ